MDPAGDVGLADVDEHHHRREQKPGRVGDVLSRPPRRGAVDRLEHRAPIPDVRRPGESDRAGDLRRDVRKDVSIEVRHDDDVEGFRGIGELRGADVHDPVFLLEVGILGPDLFEDLVEEAVGELHDVVFREAGHLPAGVAARVLEGMADDLFAARPADELQALDHVFGLPMLDARVEVLLVLAHDHDVHPRMKGSHEGVIGDARAHVGVKTERLPDGDVQALETSALRGRNRCFQEGPCAAERLPGRRFDSGACPPAVNALTDLDLLDRELRSRLFEHGERCRHDLGADSVACRDGNGRFLRHGKPPKGRALSPSRRCPVSEAPESAGTAAAYN